MASLFGVQLTPALSGLVYGVLALALLVLIGSIWYYWMYSRKIERFLQRDNEHNNMMRQDLVDSFVERGEEEWPCSICFHANHPRKSTCVMCGTPQVLKKDEDPSIARASGLRPRDFMQGNGTILNQQSRVRSFHVRRLKQMDLTARQKAALRRHLWKRQVKPDGTMRWVRIDVDPIQQTNFADSKNSTEYSEMSTPKSVIDEADEDSDNDHEHIDIMEDPDDVVGTMEAPGRSSSESLDEHNKHIALALQAFGEVDRSKEIMSLQCGRPTEHGPDFRPLRATALKNLEEAEERPTLVNDSFLVRSYVESQEEQSTSLAMLQHIDEGDERQMENDTAVSTGYVRHEDADGDIQWAPAAQVKIVSEGKHILCDDNLEEIAALTFHEKNRWFLKEVQKRWRKYEEGHIQFVVRRDQLVTDSMEQMLTCPPSRFWERLRIYFENEAGLDAGGLIREWYELLSETLFSEDLGLFLATKGENMGYWINPASAARHKDHLLYYEFVGRLLAKALIEGYNMKMSLALPLIKHMLGVPISFSDLEFLDEDLYKNAVWMKKNDHAEMLSLDFTVQVITVDGRSETTELKPGGADIEVDDSNKKEYLELLLKHYMFESISDQLSALLKGFYEVIPSYIVTVFDYQEFDLLISGVPDIDINDWYQHTEVRWMKLEKSSNDERKVIDWFWEVLAAFTPEERARVLQFATGTSRVPVQGFKALMSSDGRVRRFTIQMVKREPPPTGLMPKGHTCFNRIDLPLYKSMEELMNYLTLVINMEISGFWLE